MSEILRGKREDYGKWYDEEHVEQVIDGLRKAGLEIPKSG
jgi:hypothetical protein